jgi:cysteine desulfurase / selenocysteine lyase
MDSIREQFPVTKLKFPVMDGQQEKTLIYLDHGASTHPATRIMDKHREFLEHYYSNIHRGSHNLSLIATDMFDEAEKTILDFVGADRDSNVAILTSNTTQALDLAAYLMHHVEGVTLSTIIEHHSNFLPHRRLGKTVLVECNKDGSLNIEDLEKKLQQYPVKLVAVTGASNVTGFMPDIHKIARMAHGAGARILVDAAQLLAHNTISIKTDNDPEHIDFLAAAGHKAYAPFGSAFLVAPKELADRAEPYIPGGGTIEFVSPEEVLWTTSPNRHQGGTPNIPGAIALAESLKFLQEIGLDKIREHEKELYTYALNELEKLDSVIVYGPKNPECCLGIITFNIKDLPHELVAAILNYEAAIATRNGCFCAHPYLHHLLKIKEPFNIKTQFDSGEIDFLPGAVRATVGIYNTKEEMDELVESIKMISEKRWRGNYVLITGSACRPIEFQARMGAAESSACPYNKRL